MVQITPLLYAIPALSQFAPPNSATNRLAVRQTIVPSSLPPACQSTCQVAVTIADCGTDISCMCTSTIGSQLEQCLSCLVSSDPAAEIEVQTVIGGWNQLCSGSLSITGGTTGGTVTTSAITGGTVPTTTTGSSSSSSSSSSVPLGATTGGAVGLKIGSMTVCILAVLAGAFISL